jgi:hypothetical protein
MGILCCLQLGNAEEHVHGPQLHHQINFVIVRVLLCHALRAVSFQTAQDSAFSYTECCRGHRALRYSLWLILYHCQLASRTHFALLGTQDACIDRY